SEMRRRNAANERRRPNGQSGGCTGRRLRPECARPEARPGGRGGHGSAEEALASPLVLARVGEEPEVFPGAVEARGQQLRRARSRCHSLRSTVALEEARPRWAPDHAGGGGRRTSTRTDEHAKEKSRSGP